VPEERLTKNQRREQARELARKEREKAQRRDRTLRWAIPTGVTAAIAAIVVIVIVVVINSAPAPQTAAGPKNMITGGIQFEGKNGDLSVVSTPGLKSKQTPDPVATSNPDGIPKIVTYVDFSCPACQAFEQENADYLKGLVSSGKATLEVHPIAILDSHYLSSRYSSRANNVGACVANFAPGSFYEVMQEMYAEQPEEGSNGLTNSQIVNVVHKAGLNDGQVDKCISGESYKKFVAAQTQIATSDPALANPQYGSLSTPTILINGQYYSGSTDNASFKAYIESLS
jgi:protein-disulfide isomerase